MFSHTLDRIVQKDKVVVWVKTPRYLIWFRRNDKVGSINASITPTPGIFGLTLSSNPLIIDQTEAKIEIITPVYRRFRGVLPLVAMDGPEEMEIHFVEVNKSLKIKVFYENVDLVAGWCPQHTLTIKCRMAEYDQWS